MKRIYIVLTYTGTILSKIIKSYTKDEFSHVSIALDEELQQMYSFGRLNPYNPFVGGFVHEGINKGTFKRFKRTKSAIYSLKINDEQYKKIQETIEQVKKSKKPYKFNSLGLFAVAFRKQINKEHSFYCAEFIKYLLENSGIQTNLPKIIRPENFKNIDGLKLEYQGKLRKYTTNPRKKVYNANLKLISQ